jgi:hypothetical protein
MTRGSFLVSVVWASCLTIASSFASVFTADCGFCLSGEAALGVDFPLPPPSGFLSRSFIPSAGDGEGYFCVDFPPSMVLSNAIARDSHGGRGAVFDCLPPRRFLMPFSTYKRTFYSLAVTAQSTITHIVQCIRRPPITGNSSFHTNKPRNMSNGTTDERSVTVSSYPERLANVGIGCNGA